MKKIQIIELYNKIEKLNKIQNTRFSYALVRNKKKLFEEIDNFQKSFTATEEMKASDLKVNELKAKFKGEELEEKLKEHYEENKELIEQIKKLNKDYAEFLQTDIEIELFKVHLEELPKELNQNELEGIWLLIKEIDY